MEEGGREREELGNGGGRKREGGARKYGWKGRRTRDWGGERGGGGRGKKKKRRREDSLAPRELGHLPACVCDEGAH